MISAAAIRRRRLVATFREAGALTRKTSTSLRDLGVDDDLFFRRLAGSGIFVNTHDDAWYLDEERTAVVLGKQRRRALIWASLGLALALLIAFAKTR